MIMQNGFPWTRATFVAIAYLSAATSSLVHAQKPPKADANNSGNSGSSTMEIAKAEGKLEAQQARTIKISTPENKELFLMLSQETVIRYTGEADTSWLVPGLMIRFSASFDQGKLTSPLKTFEVFMPLVNARLNMEQKREQTPGIYQEGKVAPEGAKGLFAENAKQAGNAAKPKGAGKANNPKNAAPAATTTGAQSFRVVGNLVSLKNNVLTIFAGQPLQLELDPKATVAVSSSDLTFASQGDTVTVSGLRNPAQAGVIHAERIEIKAANKLTQAQPAPRGRTRGKDAAGAKNQADAKSLNGKPSDKATDGKKTNPNDKKPGNTRAVGANKPNR